MKPWNLVLTTVVAFALIGCATPGRQYDDGRVARIARGQTTETELLEWFGPPSTRAMSPDGSKTMAWKFAKAKPGTSGSAGKLDVRLDKDGKVTAYTASGLSK